MVDKQVVANGPLAAMIPDAVRAGDTVYLSGVVSVDENLAPLHEGDFLAQNRQAYAQIRKTLAEFGAGMGNVVKETVYVTDMSLPLGDPTDPWMAYIGMRDEIYGGKGAEVAQSLVQVAALVMPELLVEIEIVAHV